MKKNFYIKYLITIFIFLLSIKLISIEQIKSDILSFEQNIPTEAEKCYINQSLFSYFFLEKQIILDKCLKKNN